MLEVRLSVMLWENNFCKVTFEKCWVIFLDWYGRS